MSATIVERFTVIDTDTHVMEPPDLWTSRLPAKWGERRPHVVYEESSGEDAWYIGDRRIRSASYAAMAGWSEFPPSHPMRWSEVDPTTWDVKARTARMDLYGIHSQLLYPNLALFDTKMLRSVADPEILLGFVTAYNDWLTDWSSEAPERLLPISTLPFWDLEATLGEMDRCAAKGHRGFGFTQEPAYFDLPELTDPHWDPMWAKAQEIGLPINFHIGSSDMTTFHDVGQHHIGVRAELAAIGVGFFMANSRTVAHLICGGVCHRFPHLNFVSVESGIGWIPFALDSLDWQWRNSGVIIEHPEYDLLPSEYFQRQIYGSFWFEKDALSDVVERIGDSNIMYETDYPHPTSMSPGPASTAIAPNDFIEQTFSAMPEITTQKILHDNAARIYKLP